MKVSPWYTEGIDASNELSDARYPVNNQINSLLFIASGSREDYAIMECDILVNRTNENLSDWTGLSGVLLEFAGDDLKMECNGDYTKSGKCHTGECRCTRGCNLKAKFVVHTVGPKYTEEFSQASQQALHSSYRNVLSVAKEKGSKIVLLPCLYTKQKKCPQKFAAEIAARTVRRFLEHFPTAFDKIILFFLNDEFDSENMNLYQTSILPTYFPRSSEEIKVVDDVDNEWGEIVLADRQIRIKSELGQTQREPKVRAKVEYEEVVFGTDSMVDNPIYKSMLKQADEEDSKDILALNIFYHGGTDQQGRALLVFVAANMNIQRLDLDRVFRYMLKLAHPFVDSGYILVYLDNDISIDNFPGVPWVNRMYEDVLGRKYKKKH